MQTVFLIELWVSFRILARGTHTCVWGQLKWSCLCTIRCLWDDSEAISAPGDQASDTGWGSDDRFRPKNGAIGGLHHVGVVRFALQLLPRQVYSVCGGLFLCKVVDWIRSWEDEEKVQISVCVFNMKDKIQIRVKQSETPAVSIKLTGVVFSNHSYALIVRQSQCSNGDVVKTSRLEVV